MSLASQLKEIGSKPNDAKFALYEALASQVVASNNASDVLTVCQHRQKKTRTTSELAQEAKQCVDADMCVCALCPRCLSSQW